MAALNLNFDPPGPVGASFMDSLLPVNGIMGPVGSAKTSCLMMKNIRLACLQPPSKIDGVRYTRALFVRETFRQLYGTTIPSWWSWFPKELGEWQGASGNPGRHQLKFALPDGTTVDFVAMFEALGDQNVEALFRGKEFNLLNLNEGDTLAPDVLSQGIIRIQQGRYPGEKHVDPEYAIKQVNIDYNAPDIENYLYALFEENKPDNYGFFRQPGGLDANAENRQRARREDYEQMEADMIAQGRPDLARRMIHNQYGFTRDGQPVYPEYRDDFHCSGDVLDPVKGVLVRCDFDQGLRPAVILRQIMPSGQMVILDELFCESGAQGLCDMLKRLIASERYVGIRVIGGRCDPAAAARDGNDAESWVDCVNRLMGWTGRDRVRVADTNDPDRRQSAVRLRLKRNVDDGRPGIVISSACRVLRKGFNSSYRFKRKRGAGAASYADLPEKVFPVSDVHDALQYGALDDGGYEEVVGRSKRQSGFWGGQGKTITAKVEVGI
jgi:hypothetical protein